MLAPGYPSVEKRSARGFIATPLPPISPLSPTPGRNFSSPGWLAGEIYDCIQQVPLSESIYRKPAKFGLMFLRLIQYNCAAFIRDIES